MPVTALDPGAALVVDLQRGLAALPMAHTKAEIVQRAGALARGFRRHARPVVLVTVGASAEAHAHSLARIFPRLGETGTTQEIIARLDQARA